MIRLLQLLVLFTPTILISQFSDYTKNYINYDGQSIQTVSANLEYDPDDILQNISQWMIDYYSVDFNTNQLEPITSDVMIIENVLIASISDNPIQLHIKIDEVFNEYTILNVFAKDYNGIYISLETNRDSFLGLEHTVHEFLSDYLTEAIIEKATENNKALVESNISY